MYSFFYLLFPLSSLLVRVQVIADSLGLASMLNKTPIVVGNCPGFVVNRVFFPYFQSATLLVDSGISP